MIRPTSSAALCALLLAGCARQEPTGEAEEAAQGEAAVAAPAAPAPPAAADPAGRRPSGTEDEFSRFYELFEDLRLAGRRPGETLLTGESLVFDYDRRLVSLEGDVAVEDDGGVLETGRLVGRFSVSNELERIEAHDGVAVRSGGREARGDSAVYDYGRSFVQLDGQATLFEGAHRLSGERIRLWTAKGGRRMVCEPNAILVADLSGVATGGLPPAEGDAEIRSDRLTYDEETRMAELEGNVRVRDPRASMNCGTLRMQLKAGNEIDWIEAVDGVIIQSMDRKALAERATYRADDGSFTLEGDPKVKQGKNIMAGERIVFWHGTQRMVCEPNARVLFYPDEETKARFLKELSD